MCSNFPFERKFGILGRAQKRWRAHRNMHSFGNETRQNLGARGELIELKGYVQESSGFRVSRYLLHGRLGTAKTWSW